MRKSKTLLKALGIKKEQPEHLKVAVAKGAGAATRYKPGDERLKKNKGQRAQLIPSRSILKARSRISEILKELQALPIARELSKLLKLPEGTTVAQGIAIALAVEALNGDVQAIKHLQLATEGLRDGAPQAPAGPPPSLSIVWVKPDGTKSKEVQQRQLDSPKPEVELEYDFTDPRTTIEPEPLPPFADKENEQ